MSMGSMNDYIISDENYKYIIGDAERDGYKRGAIPRPDNLPFQYSSKFEEHFSLIPREEWPERCKQQIETKSRLSDLRHWKSLDQNGQGFCWAYSTTGCVMHLAEKMGLPFRRLSAHAVACKIFNFQDRGAWGALSMQWITEHGIPDVDHWQEKSMSRSFDKDSTWQNAKKRRITEGFIDLNISHPADANLSFDEVATLLLSGYPVVVDFNWWAHSVYAVDLVDRHPEWGTRSLMSMDRWGLRIQNSWTDNWGSNGMGLLVGNRAIPDGGCCPISITMAA